MEAVKKILSAMPDYGRAPHEYVVALTESLSWLNDEQLSTLTDTRSGLATVCKYLPSVADIHEFLKGVEERRNKFKPAPTHYRRFTPQQDPEQPPAERRREQVRAALGYDPQNARERNEFHNPTPPLPADFSSAMLKTPDRPVSEELKQLLRERGAGHLIRERATA